MSLINDVNEELANLEQTPKNLRQFSGLMFVVSSIFLYYLYPHFGFWFGVFTVFFVIFLNGLLKPKSVMRIHRVWMGLAFFMGWFVSRFLLSLIYFIILTPIGLLTKLFGKVFIETGFKTNKDSYWNKRVNPKIDYTKMS